MEPFGLQKPTAAFDSTKHFEKRFTPKFCGNVFKRYEFLSPKV